MFNRKTVAAIVVLSFLVVSSVFAQELKDNWNDFLHYTKIARLDLAKGYAQAIIDSDPDPVALMELYEGNQQGALILQKANTGKDEELVELSGKLLDIIEKGRYIKRSEPKTIAAEVRRLTSTPRGLITATRRLKNAGEYAIPFMLDAIADESRKAELPNIVKAMPQIGRDAIRPLAAALQTDNVALKAEVIKSLGKIGYPQSLAHLKYVAENDKSSQLRDLAMASIRQIDSKAMNVPACELFYKLAEEYYYHAESLAPAEKADFANVWFWDAQKRQLIMNKVDAKYFYELMAMRSCEWALKADPAFGRAIGLWLGSYFKAEQTGVAMPAYFGDGHADAFTYATTAGPEYLHQALARALADKNAYIALGTIEALAQVAGESSLMYRLEIAQPLVDALMFNNKAVKYSAAIAIAAAGPTQVFPEAKLIIANLSAALAETGEDGELANAWVSEDYSLRAAKVMFKAAQTRNAIVNLPAASDALIKATKSKRPEIQTLVAEVLARINSPEAQRAIAAMAMNEKNSMDIRIAAFGSLATSAKINGNMLDDKGIAAIYSLVGSKEADANLRSAAASAYGSLNLPSEKVKDLILDQAKS